MAKSNMRSVRRRKTNRRIQTVEYDRRQQLHARAYETRSHERAHAPKSVGVMQRVGVYWRRATTFLLGLVMGGKGTSPAISALDLLGGGVFSSSVRRDAGAVQLRAWFWEKLKLRSTRDGRRV